MSWSCLRMHAGYRCRHAGVCCHADWEIPAENQVIAAVEVGSLRASAAGQALMAELAAGADLHVPRHTTGACMFFAPSPAGSCALHREAGEAALPSACRHFPREFLVDARGTLVSLSHYCPTAAELLKSTDALDVVDGTALRIGGAIEGLDAGAALPPLLRPGVLTDMEGYAAWERACLALLSDENLTARDALVRIETLTERIRRWTPGEGTLAETVYSSVRDGGVDVTSGRSHAKSFAPLVAQHVAEQWFPVSGYEDRWQELVEGDPAVERIARNYLGARLFANWVAYQGRGLRTIVEWLHTCHAVFRNELALRLSSGGSAKAFRHTRTGAEDAVVAAGRADLLLVHTVDSHQFATFFLDAEQN